MRTLRCIALGTLTISLATGLGANRAQAQATSDPATSGPPPVLVTVREVLKPGKEGPHGKTEAAYAAASKAAKSQTYYLGMASITGMPRAVFFSGYSSLADVEKSRKVDDAIPGLNDKLDKINEQDGELLSELGVAFWRLRPELSSSTHRNLAEMHMAELVQIDVKLGHGDEFEAAAKKIVDAWAKVDPDYDAMVYSQSYGPGTDDVYLVILPIKSMAELDKRHDENAAYHKALGEEEGKKLAETVKNFDSDTANLFAFSPRMSLIPDIWAKYDPAFWRPKPAAAPVKKTTSQ